jgi:hypothetical protein
MGFSRIFEARKLFFGSYNGVLSTIASEEDISGYPFGSLTPYAIDKNGEAIILISEIAQHTKNILSDPRVSLTVVETMTGEVQAKGRFTYLGKASKVDENEVLDVSNRYFALHPESKEYFNAHGFSFYRIKFEKGRFIGGFGKIFWINQEELLLKNHFTIEEERSAIEHMNNDHQKAIFKYLDKLNLKISEEENPLIARINPFGFDIRVKENLYFYPFPELLESAKDLRNAFKTLA